MIITGKISTFGGKLDIGMKHDEGLTLYEHWEANLRPDLFLPRSQDLTEGTSKRLRNQDAFYFAFLFDMVAIDTPQKRRWLQSQKFRMWNPDTGVEIFAWIVDRGPAPHTGRKFDLSDAAASELGLQTDGIVSVELGDVLNEC